MNNIDLNSTGSIISISANIIQVFIAILTFILGFKSGKKYIIKQQLNTKKQEGNNYQAGRDINNINNTNNNGLS